MLLIIRCGHLKVADVLFADLVLDWLDPLATQRLVAHYTKRLHSLGFKVTLVKGTLM